MIYFNINIRNPNWSRFKNIWHRAGDLPFKHKHWEIQVTQDDELFRVEVDYTIRQDHAGLRLEFGLFGYKLGLSAYDSRHWDYETNCWKVYDQ